MYSRWLMFMPAIVAAAPLAAQDPNAEIALIGCKHAVIEEVVQTGGRAVSTVRFPPGAVVWVARQTGSRVEGTGQYRTGERDWHDFTYHCTYDHLHATARVKVQRSAKEAAGASQASRGVSPTPPTPTRDPPR